MSTRSERKARTKTLLGRMRRGCIRCGEKGARHFVPPSHGDPGFYICSEFLERPSEIEVKLMHDLAHAPFGCPYADRIIGQCAEYRNANRSRVVDL